MAAKKKPTLRDQLATAQKDFRIAQRVIDGLSRRLTTCESERDALLQQKASLGGDFANAMSALKTTRADRDRVQRDYDRLCKRHEKALDECTSLRALCDLYAKQGRP